jgi:ABC-2 type transport system ATP-binding protein
MIQLDQVSFGYERNKELFKRLSLHLEAGHVYGLLGKNGAGKSSLIRTIAGLLYPTKGKIEVGGFEPRKRQPAFLQEIYFLPEEIHLPAVSIERYLSVMTPFYPRFDAGKFWLFINEFDIPIQNKLTHMSYGQKKKILIAFALATNTKILLMDEPTNGLDIPSKSQFRKIVSSAVEMDRLILISTHQTRDLDHLIDEVIVLENSEILIHHSLAEVAEKLRFETLKSLENNSKVLYSEPSLRGYKVVAENIDGEDSKVDLEHLFNATINNPDRIRSIFKRVR